MGFVSTSAILGLSLFIILILDQVLLRTVFRTAPADIGEEPSALSGKYGKSFIQSLCIFVIAFIVFFLFNNHAFLSGAMADNPFENKATVLLSFAAGAINAVLFYNILGCLKGGSVNTRVWITALFTFGTVHFYLTAVSGGNNIKYIAAVLFLLLSFLLLLKADGKISLIMFLLSGISVSIACIYRMPMILTLPVHLSLILFYKKKFIKELITFLLGVIAPIAVIFFIGSLWPEGLGEVTTKNIFYHLSDLFILPPDYLRDSLSILPNAAGMAITFTTPAIYYAFAAKGRKSIVVPLWISAILMIGLFTLTAVRDIKQFGIIGSMDFIPVLMLLAAFGISENGKDRLDLVKKLLILLCIFINGWGIITWYLGLK